MSVFVESVDVDRAWKVYYRLADRRHQPGLTIDQLRQVIEAALVGTLAAEEETESECKWCIEGPDSIHEWTPINRTHRFVSPWVEVEEHQ